MKVGYTPMETYQMFRSLRKEVFSYFDYDQPLSFGVRPQSSGLFSGPTIAHCDFSATPDRPWSWGDTINEYASGIRVNAEWLPYMHEDEMLCVLLHELAHVTAGWCNGDGHGLRWQRMAAEVGAIPKPDMLIRNWKDMSMFAEGTWDYRWAISQPGPTMDVFAGSL